MPRTSAIRRGRNLSGILRRVGLADREVAVGNSYIAGIDAPTAKFLQKVAWETVQDYYAK